MRIFAKRPGGAAQRVAQTFPQPASPAAQTREPAPVETARTGVRGHSLVKIPLHSKDVAPPDPGQPVPGPLRARFERVTGFSVDAVRVHTGPASQRAAEALEALALTLGPDIHFAAGKLRPGTADGDHLLAHELTHTVQQRAVVPVPQMQLEVAEPDNPAEEEADRVADAVLEDDELEEPSITERPSSLFSLKKKQSPKKKQNKKAAKPSRPAKAAKPKPILFNLFSARFTATVDAATHQVKVTPVRKAEGWTFTPGGPNQALAERTLDHAEYVHAGGAAEPLVERSTITVPVGGPATATPVTAELGSPPKLTIALSGGKTAAKRKSVTVNAATIEQLDLPANAITFTPVDGDAIHLALGGDAWVYTTLKPDPVPPAKTAADVKGFFRVGYFTRYIDHGVPTFGIATSSVSDAARKKAIDDLTGPPTPKSRQITTEEAEMLKTVSLIESDFAGVQTYDTGILSFGFSQWTVNADLPRLLLKVDATTFERYLGRYGLAVSTPVRQRDGFVQKFVGANRAGLGVRNPSEGALFLDSKELVNKRLLAAATTQSKTLGTLARQAGDVKAEIDAAAPDLKSKDPARKAAAVRATAKASQKVDALIKAMAGLAGLKKVRTPGAQADLLKKVATDGEAAAKDLVANCTDSEVMRGEQWALRFEMLGQSPGGQDAQIAEVRANWRDVSAKKTHGTDLLTLLPNVRGRAALLSSYLNTHAAVAGVGRAVDLFKAKKIAEAKAAAAAAAKAPAQAPATAPATAPSTQPAPATEADWKAFPWKSGDARWKTLWTAAAIAELEALAIIEVTQPTTDPKRRRGIIKSQFP